MKSILLGNGINIQFGGKAYSNYFIIQRIRCRARLGSYRKLFKNTLTDSNIIDILDSFVIVANGIRSGDYDKVVYDNVDLSDKADTIEAINDFKKRYKKEFTAPHEIMLEDWYLILHIYFLKNNDIENGESLSAQGFERLMLDGIYNDGKIQNLNSKIPKKVKKYLKNYDNIFTLNYDDNIERLTGKKVYHLHGDFNVLANSENPENVEGYLRMQKGERVVEKGMEHCFCNALFSYSGKRKQAVADDCHKRIIEANEYNFKYNNDVEFQRALSDLKKQNYPCYEKIMTKIQHPELNMATEYYFYKFAEIKDELHIIGLSPNNDDHIFSLIKNNSSLQKVIFYYFLETEKKYIEEHFTERIFSCESVQDLWKTLGCGRPKYNCKYERSIPGGDDLDFFINAFNDLSRDYPITKEDILKEISETPQFEIERLYQLVEEKIESRKPEHPHTKEEVWKSWDAINYLALQEGIYPPTLYMISVMGRSKKIKS